MNQPSLLLVPLLLLRDSRYAVSRTGRTRRRTSTTNPRTIVKLWKKDGEECKEGKIVKVEVERDGWDDGRGQMEKNGRRRGWKEGRDGRNEGKDYRRGEKWKKGKSSMKNRLKEGRIEGAKVGFERRRKESSLEWIRKWNGKENKTGGTEKNKTK